MEKRGLVFRVVQTGAPYNTTLMADWTLAGLELSSPSFQTNLVNIPGRDGPLDLSFVLTGGEPVYNSRTLSADLDLSSGSRKDRETKIQQMIATLDGYQSEIVLPDYPSRHLLGRVHVVRNYNDLAHASVTVTATCDPWLYNNLETKYNLTATTEAQTVEIVNSGRKTVVPVLEVTGSVNFVSGSYTWSMSDGTYQLPEMALAPGAVSLTYSGSGTIQITYREAVLL